MSEPIQCLWIGPRLSAMERASLASFVRHGHDVHLYTYGDVDGVPGGVTVRDGREILAAERIFRYREHDTVSGFSNYFRYKLLSERGGLRASRQPPQILCPIPFWEWRRILEDIELPDAHAVHLWNELWRRNGIDKDAAHDSRSLYERLKRSQAPCCDAGHTPARHDISA